VGVAAGVAAGVPASVGSPVAAGLLVASVPPGVVPPSQAPRIADKLKIAAKPKILVFITPLSPIVARTTFRLMNTITYLLLFFKFLKF
jgi:hypothetical protein